MEFVHLNPHAAIFCKLLCYQEDSYRHIRYVGYLILNANEVEELPLVEEVYGHCSAVIQGYWPVEHHSLKFIRCDAIPLARREILVPVGASKGLFAICLSIEVWMACAGDTIFKAKDNIWTLIRRRGTVKALANQYRWSIGKVVGRLLFLQIEGKVVDMPVPSVENGIADSDRRIQHYTWGVACGIGDVAEDDMPVSMMVTIEVCIW